MFQKERIYLGQELFKSVDLMKGEYRDFINRLAGISIWGRDLLTCRSTYMVNCAALPCQGILATPRRQDYARGPIVEGHGNWDFVSTESSFRHTRNVRRSRSPRAACPESPISSLYISAGADCVRANFLLLSRGCLRLEL
jgi:hypothetical protein